MQAVLWVAWLYSEQAGATILKLEKHLKNGNSHQIHKDYEITGASGVHRGTALSWLHLVLY